MFLQAGTVGENSELTGEGEEDVDIVATDSSNPPTTNLVDKSSSLEQQNGGSGGPPLSLDAAIVKSIELCPNDEIKKKMFSCILLVGGGASLRCFDRYLASKLALQVCTFLSTFNCVARVFPPPMRRRGAIKTFVGRETARGGCQTRTTESG